MFAIYGLILFVAGLNKRWVFFALVVVFGALIILKVKFPYLSNRINNWHPLLTKTTSNSQIDLQLDYSLSAMGHGGIFGQGPGNSTYKYLLPESHNDFIFAIIAEEFGLLFTLFGLAWYFAFFGLLLRSISLVKDYFGFILASSLLIMIMVYLFINLGVVIGFLPNTGLPLPLISSGGSNMMISLLALGIIYNILMNSDRVAYQQKEMKFNEENSTNFSD